MPGKFIIMFHNLHTGKIVYGVRKYEFNIALKRCAELNQHSKMIKHYPANKES